MKVGGLMSYGANVPAIFRRRVFMWTKYSGCKPSTLPVEQPNLFRSFVKLRTAKALGVTIPPTLLVLPTR